MPAQEFNRRIALRRTAKGLWELTPDQYAARRWVFHGTSRSEDLETLLREGVQMANVPQNPARQRYQRGEYAEYAPGAGVGQGLYVSGSAYTASEYGRHVVAIEIRSDAELALPPESNARDLADAWKDHNGLLVVRDIPADRVFLVARYLARYITGDPYETAVELAKISRRTAAVDPWLVPAENMPTTFTWGNRTFTLKYNPTKRNHASQWGDDVIELGPEFFAADARLRRAILLHEIGHVLSDIGLKDPNGFSWEAVKYLPSFGHLNGQTTPGEVAAEAYSVAIDEPDFLRQHAPKLLELITDAARQHGFPLTAALSSPPADTPRAAMKKTAALPPEPFGMLVDDEGMAYLDGLPIYEYPTWDPAIGISDFRPFQASLDVPDVRSAYTEASSDDGRRLTAGSDHPNVLIGELGLGIGTADESRVDATPLGGHVGHVLGVGAQKPVPGVAAPPVVAGVQNMAIPGVTDQVGVPPAMGSYLAPLPLGVVGAVPEVAVPTIADLGGPRVAGIGATTGVNLGAPALFGRQPSSIAHELGWYSHEGIVGIADFQGSRRTITAGAKTATQDTWREIPGLYFEVGRNKVSAYTPESAAASFAIGRLTWYPSGEIMMISVHESFRRRGLATELFRRAKEVKPDLHHSTTLSDAGKAWSPTVSKKKISRLAHFLKTAEFEAADPLAALTEVFETIDDGEHTHSGLIIKAVDSGRVLLTQRTPYAEDPEGVYGRWEFPGGGIGEGEDAFTSAVREFREETGLELPEDWAVAGHYENGPYLAVVVLVPHEAWTTNASMLSHEVMGVGWFSVDQIEDTDLGREELGKTDWDLIKEADCGKFQDRRNRRQSAIRREALSGPFGWVTKDGEWQQVGTDGYHSQYDWHDLNGDVRWRYSPVSHELILEVPAAALNAAQARSIREWINDTAFEVHDIYVDTDLGSLQWSMYDSGETLADFFRKLQAGSPVMAMLHDEPEAALPSTDGSTEEADDPMSPAAIAQRQALLGDTDNLDIASAAKAYLAKVAVKRFTPLEQMELIEEGEREGVTASNLDLLEIAGTHYEALEDRYRYLDHAQSAAEDLFL